MRLELARGVIRQQITALEVLAAEMDGPFDAAVGLITGVHGKLVVTGMGKAGLIGQKISATLRSTGQPSVFLDPAQALHGDMGMLGFGDGLLALSNSGQTDEVRAVIDYARDRDISVIAMTADPDSPIARSADVALVYPRMPEGCPIGRAPMASTLMMLALGDSLAAVLMAERGFTEQDFLALHHGGYLGKAIAGAVQAESS